MEAATKKPIVVVTPVKNEAWILDRFLSVTSTFADLIIVADQDSTDEGMAICARFDKVRLIKNPSGKYDEAQRQLLLLQAARAAVSGDKIILALDADEILAANALHTPGWHTMLRAPAGTVLLFEKPDLLEGVEVCLRYPTPFPMGYVDDGAEHQPKLIHSIRVPMPPTAKRLFIGDVKFLHYACTRPVSQDAKQRRYSILENLLGTTRVFGRRSFYAPRQPRARAANVRDCPPEWFKGWESIGIDMKSVAEDAVSWYDIEILRAFAQHGARRFWLDAIWDRDWEASRRSSQAQGVEGMPTAEIVPPPKWLTFFLKLGDLLYAQYRKLAVGSIA